MLPQEVAAFRSEFDQFLADVNDWFEQIDARFERLEQHVRDDNDRLYSRMRSLHEDLISRLKTLGEGRERPKRKR